jgi:hypothetical protein
MMLAALVLAGATGAAHAGGSAGSLGVGAERMINSNVSGVSANYDTGMFHVGGFLGINDPDGANNTDFTLGARFFYHVASTANADFGVGGGLGILSDAEPGRDRATGLFIEPAFQIRAFVVPNVALSFTGGFSIGAVDAGGLSFNGQLQAAAGVHYYFFK